MITLALITWLIPIAINIYVDRHGAKRNYLQVNSIRGFVLIVHSVIFFKLEGGDFYWRDIQRNAPIVTFYISSYWIFFDAGLNVVTGRVKQLGFWKGILYRDTKEKDSGWIEKLFVNNTVGYVVSKSIALLLLICSIIIIYVNN